jgi:hypothetical protein
MMKDLSHLDKKLENRTSAKYKDGRPSNQNGNKQNANDLLNSYLNQVDNNANDNSALNHTSISHVSQKSKQG